MTQRVDKRALIAIPLGVLLAFAVFSQVNRDCFVSIVYGADAYGSDIDYVEIWQWNGTDYVLRHNITTDPGGATYRIYNEQVVKFIVSIMFNDTLASSNQEAIDFTKVYANITDGGSSWNNAEFNNTACSSSGGFYWLKEEGVWNQTGKPTGGVTYAVSIRYDGYY